MLWFTHSLTRLLARTHTRARAHTHTHTHTHNVWDTGEHTQALLNRQVSSGEQNHVYCSRDSLAVVKSQTICAEHTGKQQ
jgi:hypothetical protein